MPNPCKNNGTCHSLHNDGYSHYECKCTEGYYGDECEREYLLEALGSVCYLWLTWLIKTTTATRIHIPVWMEEHAYPTEIRFHITPATAQVDITAITVQVRCMPSTPGVSYLFNTAPPKQSMASYCFQLLEKGKKLHFSLFFSQWRYSSLYTIGK